MNLDFLENILEKLNMPKKADPDKVHKSHVRSRKIHINSKMIIAAFAVLVVLLAVASIVTINKEKENLEAESTVSGETSETVLAMSETELGGVDEAFSGNILLAFTRDGNADLRFLAVVNFDGSNDGIKIAYIPVTTVCTVNKIDGTMKEHLANGGITELLWAVGERYSLGIEKYILLDEGDFVSLMKYLGDTDITIEKQISHDYNGLNFIIEEGAQTFTADTMLKYYVYLCDTMWDDPTKLTNITASIAKRIADYSDATVEEKYNDIIGFVSTDFSAMDVKNYEQAIYNIVENGNIDKIEIVSDASVFAKIK